MHGKLVMEVWVVKRVGSVTAFAASPDAGRALLYISSRSFRSVAGDRFLHDSALIMKSLLMVRANFT